ncbi:MAG TPA: hypothetical protein VHP83_07835 [Aggregatilineaceae bacterium]|nr:hypothetical protein [Aggregatilineaceae bacterium]
MATRKEILEKLAAGEIDITRATEMLNTAQESVEPPAAPALPPAASESKSGRRWLKIHVSNLETGKSRVRVNVPLGLVNLGLKIGARFTDEVDEGLMHDVLDSLKNKEITGTLVEVEDEDDNERVHIFIE